MKNPCLMGWNLDVTHQCWVAPDAERIIGKAAGADDLAIMGAPSQAGHLRAGVNAVHSCSGSCVPEMNVTII